MAFADLRSEERAGLVVALALHAALVAALVWGPKPPQPLPLPERMTVTLSDDVALTSTSPDPAAQPAPDEAPVLGEQAAPAPVPLPRTEPVAKPAIKAAPIPPPRPVQRVVPRPQPTSKPAAKVPSPPRPAVPVPPRRPAQPAGGSRVGNDFLKGVSGAKAPGTSTNPPAATIDPAVRSALAGAISRQLKPRWAAPQGAEADKLVTVLSWSLNRDGSLVGAPRMVRQDGITEANRAQAARHAEQAVRAVQLAAPFTLPPEYYDAWKRIADFRFDRRLSQ